MKGPPRDVSGFPRYRILGDTPLYRLHLAKYSPVFFCSDRLHRLDLEQPTGCCHFADAPMGAFLEVFQDTSVVPHGDVLRRQLSTVRLAAAIEVADCTHRLARPFGIDHGFGSTRQYAATQAWAERFHEAGFLGVRYFLRNDPSGSMRGLALFGATGLPRDEAPLAGSGWTADTDPIPEDLLSQVADEFGILVTEASP